jgi:uncharacterized damage-inducible protein DinB
MTSSLTFSAEDARKIFAYNRAVFDRFARKVRRLPAKEATRKRGIGHESLMDTLVHVLNVHEVWIQYILQGRTSDKELGELFDDPSRRPKSWKEFDAYANRVFSGVERALSKETWRTLGRRVKVFWMPGHYTARDGLLQSTIEQAHHLGEVIGALWQDDRKPPEMTWIDVNRDLARKVRKS